MRKTLLDKLWRGVDPFSYHYYSVFDLHGWGSDHPWLADTIRELNPVKIIVDVGVWKGASTIHMANTLRSIYNFDGVVIAVDTFQGSAEHWLGEYRVPMWNGKPSLYDTFIENVRSCELENWIVPLPIDSINAAMVLSDLGLRPDVIHLDAAHDAMSVSMDLQAWWPLLRDGGVLIGDDYCQQWPGVVAAFDAFAERYGVALECSAPKARLRKPLAG